MFDGFSPQKVSPKVQVLCRFCDFLFFLQHKEHPVMTNVVYAVHTSKLKETKTQKPRPLFSGVFRFFEGIDTLYY